MIERRSQLDKIIITAMDRFVWFVLLVVMSHLVAEFTRVTGYARGSRPELVLVNDSLLQPMPVQNMLLYPSAGHYEQRPAALSVNSIQQNAALLLGSLAAGVAAGGGGGVSSGSVDEISATNSNLASGEPSYPLFSIRPLIDSIFEIPISTLRAVNNLVGRLTGGYRQPTTSEMGQKSAITIEATDTSLRLPPGPGHSHGNHAMGEDFKLSTTTTQRKQMREELA
ncbi:uncharacterized protein Dwil_GK23057 [Drosophila willistoni]|uniref:Uncharacterized protein n=1 Tax=Drosophila willistoni TaxID=7260 RepID=B4NMN7_DROWI|nr:uncharacterized protein LOC6652542 isoform X2 [Drosophila willistoni]EDW85626.2 uncharacterized protein Dwil_GK23057 [Drosophila willistoni]